MRATTNNTDYGAKKALFLLEPMLYISSENRNFLLYSNA